jgi:hypothetical protein
VIILVYIYIYILEGYEWLITSSPAELDTEGLFRVPGGQTEILKLKDIFDKGRPLTRVKRITPPPPTHTHSLNSGISRNERQRSALVDRHAQTLSA